MSISWVGRQSVTNHLILILRYLALKVKTALLNHVLHFSSSFKCSAIHNDEAVLAIAIFMT